MQKGNRNQLINWLLNQDENKIFEIKEYREKRSLNANAYFYVLQNKLAQVLNTSNDELHFELLKRYSDATIISIFDDSSIKGLCKYYEEYKTGEVKGIPVTMYKAYRPSSEMDTKQFSRLLDGLISECKEVDIETMTPDELRRLEGYEIQTNNNK